MVRGIGLLFIVCFISCDKKNSNPEKVYTGLKIPSKLEKLLSLQQDTVLDYYDLSNDFLTEFPDLSAYTIRSLNLSHNYLDTVIIDYWPKGLERLNLSYNYITKFPSSDSSRYLKELNLSHNYIEEFGPYFFIDRLDLSFNRLVYIFFYWSYYHYYRNKKLPKNMSYLNISNNPDLNNKVMFVPFMVDTIIHENIANKKKIQMIDWMFH